MTWKLVLFLLIFPFLESIAQSEEVVFFVAEKMPEFPGGDDKVEEYINSNLIIAGTGDWEGIVYVKFVVDTSGQVVNPKIVKGLCEVCDKEAIRVVQSMPKWKPGMQGEHKVNIALTIPIRFPK